MDLSQLKINNNNDAIFVLETLRKYYETVNPSFYVSVHLKKKYVKSKHKSPFKIQIKKNDDKVSEILM